MSIRDKMRPLFRTLDGGLFSEKAGKADVGDAVSKLQAEGGTLMCWADPFYPDRVIPQKVLERSVEVIQQGVACHYTPPIGNADLKEVIAKKIERDNHIKVNPQRNIIINPGSDVGLYFAMTPFIEPGDEVLVHDPSYPSNFLDPQLLNGVVVKVPTYEEDNYRLRVEEYEKRLTPKTKMVLLSSPNNPTGAVMEREDLEAIAEVLRDTNVMVLSDEIYAELNYGLRPHVSIATLPGMAERTVVVNGFSKTYAMTGWRLGYACGPAPIIKIMTKIHQSAIMSAPTTSQYAAITALRECDGEIDKMRDEYNMRRRLVVHGFNSMGLTCFEPRGAFYAFPCIKSTGMTSQEFCTKLLEQKHVALVPGDAFGASGEGYCRVSYAYSVEHLTEAMKRIREFLKENGINSGEQ